MDGGIYQIIVICVAAIALFRGFRSGLTRQICGLLGFGFGAVFSVIFSADVAGIFKSVIPSLVSYPFPPFIYSILASATIYTFVYYSVRILTRVLLSAMKVFHIGMFDRLLGAAFCLLKYLLFLSIIYNLIICIDPESSLLKYSQADDGNMVASVLMIAPDILGCLSVEDLSHALQLLEAKKISFNFNNIDNVIINKETLVTSIKNLNTC